MRPNQISASYLRNFVFGIEDGLVSTVGLLSGIAITGVPKSTIILTGLVLIFVEAFSMAVGSLLSEHTAEDYLKQSEAPFGHSLKSGLVMFFSYLFAGFIPLFPYLVLLVQNAFWLSMVFSLITLFVLGVIGARISNVNVWRNSTRMVVIGGIAILIGVLVGRLGGSLG